MTSLKHKTISGIKWVMLTSVIQRILSFGATIILARILTPADYGLFALAFVMIDGFGIFKSLGFDSALVRRKDGDIEKAANTAFFLIPAMGMILFGILFFVAPFGATALGNPQVAPIIRTLGMVFVISCFGKVPQTMLYRDMRFKYRSLAEMSGHIIYIATALTLALNKFGVWSLVMGYLARNLVQVSMEWIFSGWRPKFEFDKTLAWEMFHFGKFILAGSIVSFFYTDLDSIVIGKFLGITMLGYYAIARNTANLLNQYLIGKMGMIMYPAYSKIQDDKEDVLRVMTKMLRYISIIALPFCIGVSFFAPEILRFVFGEKWLPAAGILRILPFAALLGALGAAIWPAFLAKGQSKVDFQMTTVNVGIFVVLVIPLAFKFQLMGIGVAVLLSAVAGFSLGLIRLRRLMHIRFTQILEPLKPALLCSILMLIPAVILKTVPHIRFSIFYFLFSGILAAATYLSVTFLMNRNLFKEMKEIFANG